MTVQEAAQILNITELTEESVKSAYKKMMKSHHPDMGGSIEKAQEINEANQVLEDYLVTGSTRYGEHRPTPMPPILRSTQSMAVLKYLHRDGGFPVSSREGEYVVTLHQMIEHQGLIKLMVSVIVGEYRYDYKEAVTANQEGQYGITCYVPDTGKKKQEITILCEDKRLPFQMDKTECYIDIPFEDYVIEVDLIREKVKEKNHLATPIAYRTDPYGFEASLQKKATEGRNYQPPKSRLQKSKFSGIFKKKN